MCIYSVFNFNSLLVKFFCVEPIPILTGQINSLHWFNEMKVNYNLMLAGISTTIVGILLLCVIVGGPEWYRIFGLGEHAANQVEQGSLKPHAQTFILAVMLIIWGCYAFSGAGLLKRLPLLKPSLVWITIIFLLRGIAFVPAYLFNPESVDNIIIISSFLCLTFGITYAVGLREVWVRL